MADGRGRMSRIQQLPKALKDRLDELLRAGVSQRAILDQLGPLLSDAGERPVSRSALNRYAQRMERVGRRIREARETAEVWVAKFGERPTGDVGTWTLEMLTTLVHDLTLQRFDEGGDDGADIDELKQIALTLSRIERAGTARAARERDLRRELAEQAAAEAEKAARDATAAAGHQLPPDALQAIREQVYGIVDA